jgi:hypothetical protein
MGNSYEILFYRLFTEECNSDWYRLKEYLKPYGVDGVYTIEFNFFGKKVKDQYSLHCIYNAIKKLELKHNGNN